MQQVKLKSARGKGRRRKVGMYNRLEEVCREYIRRRAAQLKITQAQFIQNACGLAGPTMPRKFKFIFNGTNGHGKK
jgi:hypothetical protein